MSWRLYCYGYLPVMPDILSTHPGKGSDLAAVTIVKFSIFTVIEIFILKKYVP